MEYFLRRKSTITLDTKIMLALVQKLLMTIRANNAEDFKEWLALGLDELGRTAGLELPLESTRSKRLSHNQ